MLQLLITGVAVGSVYALMALGFVLIFKASSVVNFGPGELVLFGAYISWATISQMHLPLYVAFPLTIATSHLWSFVIALLLLAGFSLFFKYTLTGMAMRATADSQQRALSLGVSVKGIFALSWCIATVVSTLAGIILGSVLGGVDFPLADHGYIMGKDRIVLDGPGQWLRGNRDVREFYLGLSEAGRRCRFRDIKFYKRRKRWAF